jgi:hypothetical protein
MDKVSELKDCVEKISKEAYKFFEKNNKVSGVRARKKLQKCKNLAQEIRFMIQKSKQELVQKKSAAAAASAAESGAGLLNQKNLQDFPQNVDNIKNEHFNSFTPDPNLNIIYPHETDSNDYFLQNNIKKDQTNISGGGFQNRTRLDDIPTWNGDRINLFN